jgi:hypothetical protein
MWKRETVKSLKRGSVKPNTALLLQRFNASTIQRFNDSINALTIQRFNPSTIQQLSNQ